MREKTEIGMEKVVKSSMEGFEKEKDTKTNGASKKRGEKMLKNIFFQRDSIMINIMGKKITE